MLTVAVFGHVPVIRVFVIVQTLLSPAAIVTLPLAAQPAPLMTLVYWASVVGLVLPAVSLTT